MTTSTRKARGALSAWLEITFQLGMALAALATGELLARSNYLMPFLLSSIAAAITGVLTYIFILAPRRNTVEEAITG
jgi:predicted MFS family arabinose efflux permease